MTNGGTDTGVGRPPAPGTRREPDAGTAAVPGTRREADACSAPYRVRFDEAGPDALLRTSVLLRYAQDLAWFHSAARGFDRAWYAERELIWLVRAAEVDVLRPVRVGSELVGTTRVIGSRRVWARRRTDFRTNDGQVAADVRIDWLLLDGRGRPARIPAEFDPIFGMNLEPVELARVELAEPPVEARTTTLRVRPQELDPMDHVNNAVYADWIDEQVIASGGIKDVRAVPRQLRLEYARSAERDSTVTAVTWRAGDGSWSCRVAATDGTDVLRASLSARPA